MKPKILLYDLETSPRLSYVWGQWEQNVLHCEKEWELLSYAYKWLGETSIKCYARPDFKDPTDKAIVKSLWSLLDQADVVIAHNGDKFDNRKASSKFLEHGLVPPSPYRSIDTLKVAKKYFHFDSNKLTDLAQYLQLGQKVDTGGFSLWLKCMAGDKASWKLMRDYNKHDVVLLEKIYLKFRPWIKNHPSIIQLQGNPVGCPKCGSKAIQNRGFAYTARNTYRNVWCKDCGGWSRQALPMKSEKPEIVGGK